jgi:hypothetical protein
VVNVSNVEVVINTFAVMGRKFVFRDLSEFRRLYWENWPERRIARYLHVDRSVVRRLIREHGLLPRTHLSANRYLAAERTEAERRAFTAAAHAARRRREGRG